MKVHKILIIDDQIDTINIIVDLLEEENPNYAFYYATSGAAGIAVAVKHKPNLIITDWEMPGLSGIETIKKLKQEKYIKEIPVVMLTGIMTSTDNLKMAFDAGAIDYIRKPINKVELVSRIRSMLLLAEYHKESMDLKNRELASTAMNVLQNNEFNLKTIERLKTIDVRYGTKNQKLSAELTELGNDIAFKIKNEAWTQFSNYFNKVHPDFTQKLLKKYPTLSPAELKLASFLRLELSTKEIASITFLASTSIKTSRNRLRKKLNLSFTENLTTFLIGF